MSPPSAEPDPWELATFAGAAQLRDQHARSLSLHERFQWLDEMLELWHFRQSNPDPVPPHPSPPPPLS